MVLASGKRLSRQYDFSGDHVRRPVQHLDMATVQDIDRAVRDAMNSPLDFPSIDLAVAPGDRVAIALGDGVPRTEEIVGAIIDYLTADKVESTDISIVCNRPNHGLAMDSIHVHLPAHDRDNAYLMASQSGAPVYVDRHLFDADVVIPVGTIDATATDELASDTICPAFCGVATRAELNSMPNSASRSELIRQINDWLGVFWGVQVVAGPANEIHQVVVGSRDAANRRAWELSQRIWALESVIPSSLVIGTIEDPTGTPTWDQIAAALITCDRAATTEAMIILCAGIDDLPSNDQLLGFLQAEPESDELAPAQQVLADLLQSHVVGLLSELDENSVEQLGFGYVQSLELANRVIQRHEDCLLIRDAHKCVIR